MRITVKCPTRVDLSGGTLDLWPLYALVPKSRTINAAISIFTQTELNIRLDTKIKVQITNTNFKKEYLNLGALKKDKNKNLAILKPVIDYFNPSYGFDITTKSESPVGGGLGGSSSLMVTLLTAFLEAENKKMKPQELVHLAHNLEAQILKTPTGTQDYVPPIMGGICCIEHNMDGLAFERLSIEEEEFNKHFLLVYTGRPHHSGLNNWEVYKKAIDGNKKVLGALASLKATTDMLYEQIRTRNLNFKKIFNLEYKSRVNLAKSFSSPEIKRLEKVCLKNGASAVKILGAGGGGCVIVWCDPLKRERLKELCLKEKFQILPATLSSQGLHVTKV